MNRIVPNSYQKPNLYTARLMRFLTGDEWKTLDYALRRTFGFNKESDRISVSQFMNGNGRLDESGEPVEYGTGCHREAQVHAIDELIRFGILVPLAPNDAQKRGRKWKLQLDEAEVRFDLIQERYEAGQEKNRKRTAKARASRMAAQKTAETTTGLADRPIDRPVEPVCAADQYRSVPQTGIGLSGRPVSVCPTDPQKHSRNPEGNPGETQSLGEAVTPPIVEAWAALVKVCEGDQQIATAVWRLQERFAEVTRLRRPDPATEAGRAKLAADWWPHLRQVLADADDNPEAAEAAMREAVTAMDERETPLNVVGPRSIVNMTAGVLAAKRRKSAAGPVAGNALALKQQPKGMSGIAAYAERRGIET